MQLEIASINNVAKPQPVRVSLRQSVHEVELCVVDALGNYRYSLLGIREDGTFVSYKCNRDEKQADGFEVNSSGQIVYFSYDSSSIGRKKCEL